jgi:transcriptional regulator with XRE-family HTH domain
MEVVRKVSIVDLSEKIKKARVADGRSVQVLATLAEISSVYWYQLENNKRSWVSEEVIRRMEKVLGVEFGIEFNISNI